MEAKRCCPWAAARRAGSAAPVLAAVAHATASRWRRRCGMALLPLVLRHAYRPEGRATIGRGKIRPGPAGRQPLRGRAVLRAGGDAPLALPPRECPDFRDTPLALCDERRERRSQGL